MQLAYSVHQLVHNEDSVVHLQVYIGIAPILDVDDLRLSRTLPFFRHQDVYQLDLVERDDLLHEEGLTVVERHRTLITEYGEKGLGNGHEHIFI